MKSTVWPSLPLRRLGAVVGGGTPTPDAANWNGEIPFVTPPDLRPVVGGVVTQTQRSITERGATSGSSTVPANSVLLSIRAPIGYVARTRGQVAFNQGCRALIPGGDVESRYVTYALLGARDELESIGRGTTFMEVSGGQMAAFEIPAPPFEVQRAIADYLDRETAQIDTLIAKQEQLIATLYERRGAVLDLLVAATDVERVPLRHLTEMITVGIVVQPSQWYVDVGIPALRGVNVRPEKIVLGDLVYLSKEGHSAHRKSELRAGDVVVVRTGKSGTAAVVPPALDGANAIDLLIARPGPELDGDYLAAVLNAPATRERSSLEVVGTIQSHLNVGALRPLTIPAPQLEQQRIIVAEWRERAFAIDALLVKTERFIELSKERRATLITAAVTGLIDVTRKAL